MYIIDIYSIIFKLINFNFNLFFNFFSPLLKKKKKKKKRIYMYLYTFSYYFNYFIEKKLNKKAVILYKNYRFFLKKSSFHKFLKRRLLYPNKIKSFRYFKVKDFSLVYSSFMFQDIKLFKNWLRLKMSKMIYKKHRRFLYFLKIFLINFFFPYINHFNLEGFSITVGGKIGLGGNSKTRTYSIRCKKFARYKKNFKLFYDLFTISTLSGSLGIKIIFLYS